MLGPAGTRSGVLLVASWAGLVLLWGTLAGQFVALREAITGYTGVGMLLARALPVWGEGMLLGPTVAGLVQWFRPQPLVRPVLKQQPQPALPADPAATKPLSNATQRLTLPSPAMRPDPPQELPRLATR